MSKPAWGKIGAWAADAERAEAEEREAAINEPPPASFPSLQEANTTKQNKKTKMSLQEFSMQASRSKGLTHEEMLNLPTGPKERSADEMQYGRLGGGFSNYGNRQGSVGSNQGRGRDYEGRRSYGFEDDDRRERPTQARVSEFNQPSRADEVDNWASMKKQTMPDYNSVPARSGGRYGSLGGGGGPGVGSRADEVDNWGSVKKPIPPPRQTKGSSFGSGFAKPEPDRWTGNQQRLVLEPQSSEVEVAPKVNKSNPFGAARPREEVLAEKGLDWKKLDSDIEVKKQQQDYVSGGSRPTSSQSSRPGTPHSSMSEVAGALAPGMDEGVARQKVKVNPFGDAKPREVLLEEKGLDWRKIDLKLEHRQVDRPESEEEKNLKEEIERLKREMPLKPTGDQTGTHDLILQKEQELELLVRQMDDNIRYSQKSFERPGSEAGRGSGFNERPPSRSGTHEEPRAGFHDIPHPMPGTFDESVAGYSSRSHSRPSKYDDTRFGVYEDPKGGFSEKPRSRSGAWEDPQPGSFERPHSRQGASEEARAGFPQRSFTHGGYQEPRSNDYNDRPRSRGSVNSWARSGDDRRTVQSSGGRGYLDRRDVDRSGSRW